MRWTWTLSALSFVACTDAPRALLTTDLPPPPPADMTVEPDLMLPTISITAVLPATAPSLSRTLLSITGTGFDSRTTFLIGGVPAEVVSVSSTQASVYAPTNTGGAGLPVSIQALRTQDGARANNSNLANSMSKFSYFASTLAFQQTGRFNNNAFVNARVPLVGDFNGDGKPDFMTTYISSANHQTFLNTGGGSFALTENSNNPPSNLGVQKGTVIDLNNDNFQDIIVADEGGTWAYMMGNGQGLFNTAPTSAVNAYAGSCGATQSPTPIKLSSATNYDVAVACQNSNVVRIWASPAGALTTAFYGTQNTANQGPTINIVNPVHLQAVDVNKDNNNDLVVLSSASNQPTLTWYNAPGAPPTVLSTTPSGMSGAAGTNGANLLNQNPYWLKCADLNGDGFPDCVVADLNTHTVRVFMNNAGVLQPPTATGTLAVAQEPREVNLVDMNGDGKLDMLVTSRGFNSFEVIPGRGDGTFGTIVGADGQTSVARVNVIVPDCLRTWSVQAADFDGDGLRDIMTTCEANAAGSTSNGGVVLFRNVSR